ncbi:MAG: NAD-dependent epimerase/dehydratase family protein [Bacteroidota bacterium]|nr:NAD-dependent epimerase/dehydratase family protein [Bacteroidota bacterium]
MILVTGATGLVGSHLIYDLLIGGFQVKALVRETSRRDLILQTFRYYSSNAEELFGRIVWAEGDVTDVLSLREAFRDVDKVYHTAAFVSFDPKDKQKVFTVNTEGTANVVNLCLENSGLKLCFVSSIAALGETEDGAPVDEKVQWKPTKEASVYSISKFKSEMEVWRGVSEGLNAVIVNPSVILGPGDWEKGSGAFFQKAANGFPFYTLGTTGFVDVRDVSKAMIQLMESDISGERFVLSSDNVSYKDIFSTIAWALDAKAPYIYASSWLSGLAWRLSALKSFLFRTPAQITSSTVRSAHKKSHYSSDKVKGVLKFEFIPIEQTIQDIAQYYRR